jgi:nitrile hydratase subunit beta
MNSIHDMGGMHGMGPLVIEHDDAVFHEYWHGRVFAMRMACAFHRKWNADMGRYARERMPAGEFLAASYYERAVYALERVLVESGLLGEDELSSGKATTPVEVEGTLQPEQVATIVRTRRKARMDVAVAPLFKVGDAVVTRNSHPEGHTRLPRYARGRRGVIDRDHGVFSFADSNAMTRDRKPQHLYSVRFAATELWGDAASPRDSAYLDLWDDHLQHA